MEAAERFACVARAINQQVSLGAFENIPLLEADRWSERHSLIDRRARAAMVATLL